MKKKFVSALIGSMVLAFATGCTSNISAPSIEENSGITQEEKGNETVVEQKPVEDLKQIGSDPHEITKIPEISEADDFDTESLFTGWLPQNVEQIMSESEPNELLKQAIIDYYEIPKEFWEQTKYYYNHVDLNGDGTEEIFAVVIGSYTSGSGGDSALWCCEYEGKMQIYQAFTLVKTPVIVTKEAVNGQEYGAKGLIMQRSGGGAEAEIIQLTCTDGVYTNVADAPMINNLDEMEGTAIICNNLIKDMENGSFLTLAD